MFVCVWGGSWCVNLVWMPLSTRLQQYCDPVSLVSTRDNRVCSLLLRTLHPFFLSVYQFVGQSPFYFFGVFVLTAPAQVLY